MKPLRLKQIIFYIVIFIILWGLFSASIATITKDHTLGTDFYVFHLAGKYTFLESKNPYSNDLGSEAQIAILGRLANPGEDKLGFAYPLYSLFLIYPLIYLLFSWSQAIWMSFLILLIITVLNYISSNAKPWLTLSVLFFYPFSFRILLGNYVILISCILLILFYFFFSQNNISISQQIILGIFLAWCTIKPQFIWLYIILLIFSSVKKRYKWFNLSFFFSDIIIYPFIILYTR